MRKGQAGGKALVVKHGREHMAEIGLKGAKATWNKYKLVPIGISKYAMVDRETGIVKTIKES